MHLADSLFWPRLAESPAPELASLTLRQARLLIARGRPSCHSIAVRGTILGMVGPGSVL